MEINQEKVEAAIVEQAVAELVDAEHLSNLAAKQITAKVDSLFKDKVEAQVSEIVNKAVIEGFDHSYCKIDSFGRQIGEPTTIKIELERMVGGYWNARVDSEGKPTDDNYRSKGTRAEWLMTKMVAADFAGEMKNHVASVAGELKDRLRAELHETVNKLLTEIFHVRSWDDQTNKTRYTPGFYAEEKLPK